ncbi:FACT complex subunit SPT16 [Kockovaella imperatae]|uniref:FACT complex subunit n=1 Tax=Kockovaella imperatae TaxID=4999 RepID=A0A1Y1UD63_9TREE|nr:FACT complex subunit SPT16 [Kockovaella imperatae]ORX35981.1 FACT complex subunit SPT16 [Kockovaella imperatae]
MSDVVLDKKLFFKRAKSIFDAWDKPNADAEILKDLKCLAMMMGDASDEGSSYTKVAALQTFLLGYEFPSTLLLFTQSPRRITFVSSPSKAKILAQISTTDGIEIDILERAKGDAGSHVIPGAISALGGGKIGTLPKDKPTGKMADEFMKAISEGKPPIEAVDMAPAMSCVLAEKDGEEMKNMITSGKLTSTAMIHYFKPKMESIIDKGTKVPHSQLAVLVEEKIGSDDKEADKKLWSKNPSLGDVDFSSTEWVYPPIIQSGGRYDLKISAVSDDRVLSAGIIIASLGLRYKNYCTTMARTFLISPTKKQESYYAALLEARNEALNVIKDGAVAKDVYAHVHSFLEGKSATLGQAFQKNMGFATGIEFRDSHNMLSPKNGRTLKENMVFVVSIGVSDLSDSKSGDKTYSLLLTDTVKVGKEASTVLTDGCTKLKDVIMELDEEEEDAVVEAPKPKANGSSKQANGKGKEKSPLKTRGGTTVGRGVGATKTRGGQREQIEQTTAEKIRPNQERLHAERHNAGLKKWANGGKGGNDAEDKPVKRYESYRREEQLPRGVEDRRLYVDEQRQTVVLPIGGYAVPFHISTIKNVTKTEEAEHIVLRINFQSPGQIAGKKEDMPFEDADAHFVRSASFRSTDQRHMLKVLESITALKKAATKREAERKEMADVVEQEKLVEIKGRGPYTLKRVFPRPADGKKMDGSLEIHQNGVRFRPDGPSSKIDVLFSNVKHLFFQPSEKELIVLIHLHLISPIMLGKKKTYDVQFYREVTDMAFDETGGKRRRARYGDEDEIEQEQEDRKHRQLLDKEFSEFAHRIEVQAQAQQFELEVDMPFRDLGFSGVPHRSNVLLVPTTHCLVHLSETPFLVITLAEVEVVHLERVQFGLKNFDMVFVMNDFKKAPIHVNNIDVTHLDNVKEWLDSCDVPISEGPVNLAWNQIMKTVVDDPYAFYEEGGWGFLTGGGEVSSRRSL